jgi:hypothetical protein
MNLYDAMKIPQDFRFTVKVLLVAFGLFAVSVLATAIHEHVWKSDIIFYSFIRLTMIYAALSVIGMMALRMLSSRLKNFLDFSTIALSSIMVCLLSYSFNMTFPVNMDRSFSVYMLGTLYKFDSPVPLSELDSIVSKYFHERGLINKRIHEQLATGSIVINDDKVALTGRGRSIVETHMLIGRLFNLDMNNIAP